MALVDCGTTRLSAWDQAAMRRYMHVALCFPFDNSVVDAAADHIKASLARLALQRPDFAGTLEVHSGGIVHLRPGHNEIPFSIVDLSSNFPYASYDELKAAEFPPAAFVGPQFAQACALSEGEPAVPVLIVKAFLIPGGLFIGIFFCHAFADGDCLKTFMECFSGQTCDKPINSVSTKLLNVPFANDTKTSGRGLCLEALLSKTPEYVVLDDIIGPTLPRLRLGGTPLEDIKKIGKIFVFDKSRLQELRCSLKSVDTPATLNGNGGENTKEHANGLVNGHTGYTNGHSNSHPNGLANGNVNGCANGNTNGRQDASANEYCNGDLNDNESRRASSEIPSNYTCLAALTWAHISRARLSDPAQYMPHSSKTDELALLQTMVNWKGRAFEKANPNYFGNATAVAVTRIPTTGGILANASGDRSELAKLVQTIDKTISGVDEEYVRDRTELFSRVSDPRLVGLRFDPRTPQDLGFNTWRHFGAETMWTIPGVNRGAPTHPDTIRRLQDAWNMSGALILPARAESPFYELLVTLPETSMDLLCNDPDWMQWVDHVIG